MILTRLFFLKKRLPFQLSMVDTTGLCALSLQQVFLQTKKNAIATPIKIGDQSLNPSFQRNIPKSCMHRLLIDFFFTFFILSRNVKLEDNFSASRL